jgi:hypothetical protein
MYMDIYIYLSISIYILVHIYAAVSVSDGKEGRCLEPEGNGVNPGKGSGGGPGPPSKEQGKQLSANRGGDNSFMEQQDGREGKSGVTRRTHRAQRT